MCVLLVVNVDWWFWSHRLSLARALREDGCEVVMAAGAERRCQKAIEGDGFRSVPLAMERTKMAFEVPKDAWPCGHLRAWAEEPLDERRIREQGLLRPEPIRAAWAEHLSGRRNEHYRLWAALMFQAWKAEWM